MRERLAGEAEGGGGKEHLSPVEGFVGWVIVVEEAHVDEVDEQAGSILGGESIISRPLVEDQQDEVTKQAGHEDDLWDEAQEDVQGLFEVPEEQQRETRQRWENIYRKSNYILCV